MKRLALALALTILPLAAHAGCTGGSVYRTCYDSYGNSYSVQRFGNTTTVQGRNAGTGSTWSQTDTTFGNSTYTQGTTNGRSWNMQRYGRSYSGRDSRGNFFSGYD
jgi:hypothetical protein